MKLCLVIYLKNLLVSRCTPWNRLFGKFCNMHKCWNCFWSVSHLVSEPPAVVFSSQNCQAASLISDLIELSFNHLPHHPACLISLMIEWFNLVIMKCLSFTPLVFGNLYLILSSILEILIWLKTSLMQCVWNKLYRRKLYCTDFSGSNCFLGWWWIWLFFFSTYTCKNPKNR